MSVHIDRADAEAVAQALREFEKRCKAIQDLLGEKRSLSLSEREHITDLYCSLKEDLKAAAKRGTLDERRRPQTQAESAFYDSAVRKAHIALRPGLRIF